MASEFHPRLDRFHEYEIEVSRNMNTVFRRRMGLRLVDVRRAVSDDRLGFILYDEVLPPSFIEDSEVL